MPLFTLTRGKMTNDPIDDLLSTPDGTVSPFDPLEASVSKEVAIAIFRAMRDDTRIRLIAHLDAHGPDGDPGGLARRRTRLQQATDALEWIASQPGETVALGCYPVDLAAENAFFERMLEANPELCDVNDDELSIPRDRSPEDISRVLRERIRDLEANRPDEEE